MKLSYLTLCDDFFNKDLQYTDDELRNFGVRLRHESAYITDYIKRGVNEEFEFDCSRVNLACTFPPIRDKIREFESVHEIDVPFDIDYFMMTPIQKEQYLINIAEKGLQRFCDAKGWDFSVFKKYVDVLRSCGDRVEFYIPKKSCRKGKLSAKVYCVQNMTEAIFFMDFFFNSTLIDRKFFAVSWPTAMTYRSNIYRLEWSNDNTVSVLTYTDKLYAQVTLDTDIPHSKSNSPMFQINNYNEQVQKVHRVKSLLCESIGIDLHDSNIEFWEENFNGQVFVILSLLEIGLHRYFAIVNSSGSVVFDFCDDYLAKADLIENFKKQNGWFDE